MTYAKPGEEAAPRRVHPYGLVSKGGTWYLLAGAEAGLRTFRLSRVRAVTVTTEAVERPEDFDLAAAWESVQSGFPARTYAQGVTVRLAVDPGAVRFISGVLGRWANLQAVDGEGAGDGWPPSAATFPTPGLAASELVRFGRRVRVEGPDEVRAALAALGEELVATYRLTPAARPAGP